MKRASKVPVTVETLVAAFLLSSWGAERELVCKIINGKDLKTPWYRAVDATLSALRNTGLVTW